MLIFVAWQSQVKRSVFSRSVKGIYHVVSTLGRRARACYGRRAPNHSPGFLERPQMPGLAGQSSDYYMVFASYQQELQFACVRRAFC